MTLLYFDDCPNWLTTADMLERLAPELGFEVTAKLVADQEDAERLGFPGSPTILVDGVDPFAEAGAPVAYSCRVYNTPDGLRGSPTIEMLRAALSR